MIYDEIIRVFINQLRVNMIEAHAAYLKAKEDVKIGNAKDNPDFLRAGATYLDSYA